MILHVISEFKKKNSYNAPDIIQNYKVQNCAHFGGNLNYI